MATAELDLYYHLCCIGGNYLEYGTTLKPIERSYLSFKNLIYKIIRELRKDEKVSNRCQQKNVVNPVQAFPTQYLDFTHHPLLVVKICPKIPQESSALDIHQYVEHILNNSSPSIPLNDRFSDHIFNNNDCLWIILKSPQNVIINAQQKNDINQQNNVNPQRIDNRNLIETMIKRKMIPLMMIIMINNQKM